MQILTAIEQYKPQSNRPLLLALGNFDGVHLGHQALLKEAVQEARQTSGGIASVFTFLEHPQSVLHTGKSSSRLTSLEQKLYWLEQLGVDLCFLIRFTREFSRMEPEDFVENVLVRRLQVYQVFLGFNARFGRARRGDAQLITELSRKFFFKFKEVEGIQVLGDFVSSSRIRSLVQEGELEAAESCLGRPYSFLARVVHGEGRGASVVGFPTANLEIHDRIMPPQGVYAVKIRKVRFIGAWQGDPLKMLPDLFWSYGVLNYGLRPTFDPENQQPVAEVHLFDAGDDLYGETLELVICKRLRSEKKFEGVEALKEQIDKDIETAREFFTVND